MTQPKNMPYIKGPSKALKKERSFILHLPALISGCDARGDNFKEKTKLSRISSQEVVIRMKNKVLLGTKLDLSLKIPKTLILENNLNLTISGKVSSASRDSTKKEQQLVSLQLDKIFKIYPISKSE
jgi:hypothetical protein